MAQPKSKIIHQLRNTADFERILSDSLSDVQGDNDLGLGGAHPSPLLLWLYRQFKRNEPDNVFVKEESIRNLEPLDSVQPHKALHFYLQRGSSEHFSTCHNLFFSSYLLNVLLQIANKNGIKKKT
jgi:hypothetical protein